MAIGKLLAQNKKAYHEYFVEHKYEVGMVLTGPETKSIRSGKVSIKESYAEIVGTEVFIVGMHVAPYEMGNRFNVDPLRRRKLLLHRKEINKIIGYTTQDGYTLVPLKVYISPKGLMKMELGVCKGKKIHDKRQSLAKKDSERRVQRELRDRQRD